MLYGRLDSSLVYWSHTCNDALTIKEGFTAMIEDVKGLKGCYSSSLSLHSGFSEHKVSADGALRFIHYQAE